MGVFYQDEYVTIIHDDCRTALDLYDFEYVHCCVTSPPYFGLRDYGGQAQIGLEQTPAAYVAEMTGVFEQVRKVLRPDGTCWLNLGDSYAGYWGDKKARAEGRRSSADTNGWTNGFNMNARPDFHTAFDTAKIKPKDLIGIPWRVAFALQEAGWWLRSDIIWSKGNPMPESVTDRPTKAHEYLFLLAKSERYYYDVDAIREPHATPIHAPGNRFDPAKVAGPMSRNGHSQWERDMSETWGNPAGRNRRTVWTVNTRPFAGAHFATFPPKLIQPCILAGVPQIICAVCGAPWKRFKQREGIHPTCECNGVTVPGTVIDPFGGAGTTGVVAKEYGRRAILIEQNEEYCSMAADRIRNTEACTAILTG